MPLYQPMTWQEAAWGEKASWFEETQHIMKEKVRQQNIPWRQEHVRGTCSHVSRTGNKEWTDTEKEVGRGYKPKDPPSSCPLLSGRPHLLMTSQFSGLSRRVLVAFPESNSSAPSIHFRQLTAAYNSSSQEFDVLCWLLRATTHMFMFRHTDTHTNIKTS